MKKGIILFAILAVACYGIAQQTLIYESFEEYTVGNHLTDEATAAGHSWWTTWGELSGSISSDGLVSNDRASEGTKSAFISGSNDNVLLLGDLYGTTFELSFDVYIPYGKMAYICLGSPGTLPNGWNYELAFYFNMDVDEDGNCSFSSGHTAVTVGSHDAGNFAIVSDVLCLEDEWMHFSFLQYGSGELEVYFDNELIISSQAYFNAVDFFGMGGYNGELYLDNVNLVRLDVYPVAAFIITPESIEETMTSNEEKTVEITLANYGEVQGHWAAYIEFEEGDPTSWAAIDKIDGVVPSGGTEHITLTLNTAGLSKSTYEARLNVMTSSRDRSTVEIPIILHYDATDVSESSSPRVTIYPNPAFSEITLEGDNLSRVSIYNIVGQLVRVEVLKGGSNILPLDLEEGVYFFRIDDIMGNHTVQKVVVK